MDAETVRVINLLLVMAMIVMQALDGVLTVKILSHGGVERNPVVRWLMDRIGIVPALVATKGGACLVLVLMYWLFRYEMALAVGVAVLAIGYVLVVVNNLAEAGRTSR